ncbi:hypothetical protein BH10ACI1_BH10ACI1_14080 [soil metagenome]
MNTKILIFALCLLNFIMVAGCSSKDPEVERIQAEIDKSNAEQKKREEAGVPAEKICPVFKWGVESDPVEYKGTPGSLYSCTTSRRIANQGLIYSASGYNNKVSTAYIVMTELFKREENIQALKLLVVQGGVLSKAFTGQPLSKEIETAITESKSGEWKIGDAKVKLEKTETQIDLYNLTLTFSLE